MAAELSQFAFWSALALIIYMYFGYPILLGLLAQLHRRPIAHDSASLPRITLLISAHNEKGVIRDKLLNSLALEYPGELIKILVISDCSDDGTDEIVLGFAARGVRLVRLNDRLGKSSGLNHAYAQAVGEILIFSDANAMYQPDAVRFLVRHFSDPQVGYVVGNARYLERPSESDSAQSEGLYWRLETWLKKKESDFGSVVGGDGAIYAIRRELYSPLRPTDINDFLNPLQIIARGYRGVYEPSAICFEEAGDTFEKEFRRKIRIVSRSLNAVRRAPRVLLPWIQPRHWFSLVSHKILRWFAPFFLLLALFASLALWSNPFYRAISLLQLLFYFLATMGWILESRVSTPIFLYLPYYFTLVNLAAVLGVLKCFGGSLTSTWQTVRHDNPAGPNDTIQLAKKRL